MTVKLVGDEIVKSILFNGWALEPTIRKYSDKELLFQEMYDDRNEYCIKEGVVRPVWEGQPDPPYGSGQVIDGGDWVCLLILNSAANSGGPGAISELWAMPWPGGCNSAWVDDLIHSSGFE